MKAIIIGSGLAGLSTAIRLKHAGLEVEVFEANSYPGGKIHSFQLGAYRFDGGPSLFTMPQLVDEIFEHVGKRPEDYFTYKKLDESCRYFWEDKTKLTAFTDQELFEKEVKAKLGVKAVVLRSYFDHIKTIYDHSGGIFLEKSLHQAQTWLNADTLKALLKIGRYDIFKTMHRANEERLEEPHLVQLFDRFATYNGSNPYRAPGILNVIPWLEHGFGTFFPVNGMQEIPRTLHRLAVDMGVIFHFNTEVSRIEHKKNKAKRVITKAGAFHADLFVSNMDIHLTYKRLLPEITPPKRILNQERSSSALVFYWGITQRFSRLGLHNILFSNDYKEEFDSLFERNRISSDPTVYINISSKHNSNDAPDYGENWFVMVNAPHHKGQDWRVIADEVRERVIKKLSRLLKTDIASVIEVEKVWSPEGIEVDTRSYLGALYGNSSNDKFSAFLRHPNYSSKINNVYFCGGSVHPGGGIPLALLSGKITSDLILK